MNLTDVYVIKSETHCSRLLNQTEIRRRCVSLTQLQSPHYGSDLNSPTFASRSQHKWSDDDIYTDSLRFFGGGNGVGRGDRTGNLPPGAIRSPWRLIILDYCSRYIFHDRPPLE